MNENLIVCIYYYIYISVVLVYHGLCGHGGAAKAGDNDTGDLMGGGGGRAAAAAATRHHNNRI